MIDAVSLRTIHGELPYAIFGGKIQRGTKIYVRLVLPSYKNFWRKYTLDKKQGVPKGLPIIGGEKDKETKALINESIKAILARLDPIMQNILQNIDGLERRLAVAEEVKQIFPAHVTVTVKHENTYAGQPLAGPLTSEEKK